MFEPESSDTFTRSDLAESIYVKIGFTRKDALSATNAVFETIISALSQGNNIELRGFGTFHLIRTSATLKTPPGALTPVQVPERRTVRFRPGKNFRQLIGDATVK